ncbi:MAG: excinuclease ABC subunit A [Myxococcota bacterium]|jgi:excinuclease ABC subunit A
MTESLADEITIRGASEHNLRDVSITLPKRKLIVFTGVSGSGKSSLAFDTLYAEGQRRYVESLSSYARQFLGQMDKPKYDTIRGLAPTISIEQRAASANPRSTVGTVTEIYDYLRVLYARAGQTHCPKCGRPTEKTDPVHIVKSIEAMKDGTKLMLLAPIARHRKGTYIEELGALRTQGFSRARIDGETLLLEDVEGLDKNKWHDIDVVVDRLVVRGSGTARLTDSVETALKVGEGRMVVQIIGGEERLYSEHRFCPYDELSLPEPTPALFSFNSPLGACQECNGLGITHSVDVEALVPDPKKSLNDGCFAAWTVASSPQRSRWSGAIVKAVSAHYKIDMGMPWGKIPKAKRDKLLHGTGGKNVDVVFESKRGSSTIPMPYEGIVPALQRRFKDTQSSKAVEFYKQYLVETPCPDCKGERLRGAARAVRLGDKRLPELVQMNIGALRAHFETVQLTGNAAIIAAEVLREIRARLGFLVNVGLDYLSLERSAATLSGGEAQRIRLASQVGAELTGVLYILDEPSIGLHQRDNMRLIETLFHLRDIGNSVLVVEHDSETMMAADYMVDFGPGAGVMGGQVVAEGTPAEIMASKTSLTGGYLSGRLSIQQPRKRRKRGGAKLIVKGARANNLKGVDVSFPLGCFTVVTGVSGAGKSSLVNGILLPALSRELNNASKVPGEHKSIRGMEHIKRVVNIDQKPIGRTPRSNPATYTKVFDNIRKVFAATREARVYGFGPGRFSFNVKGGRCEACEGAGVIKIEMHFLADVYVQCETCQGKRFNEATLRVHFKGKNIFDVLEMSVTDAFDLFENHRHINRIVGTLKDVGLGYITLGQAATTLSGGEAQRVKLARELAKQSNAHTLYILDEPSTGLHFEDVKKLLAVVDSLVDGGHTVIMIEHNLDIIKTADYLIDIGPEGGDAGGYVVAKGTPEDVAKVAESHTGRFLAEMLA